MAQTPMLISKFQELRVFYSGLLARDWSFFVCEDPHMRLFRYRVRVSGLWSPKPQTFNPWGFGLQPLIQGLLFRA